MYLWEISLVILECEALVKELSLVLQNEIEAQIST